MYYLHVPGEGSLLPKYSDCTLPYGFQLHTYIYICERVCGWERLTDIVHFSMRFTLYALLIHTS